MDHRSPTFEANLLYKTAPDTNSDALLEDIQAVLAAHETMLERLERVDSVFTLIHCDTVDVLLAFTDICMPVAHFENVQRPAFARLSEAEVLGRLSRHESSVTVLVVAKRGDDATPARQNPDRMRAICRDLTALIHDACAADLVYWSDNDTLYAGEEFSAPDQYAAPPEAELPPKGTQRFAEVAEIDATLCWDIVEDCVPTPKSEDRKISSARGFEIFDTALALALPNRAVLKLDDMMANLTMHRLTNGFSMLCASTTIGISSLPGLVS